MEKPLLGRPPKKSYKKLVIPVRAMVSYDVSQTLANASIMHGISGTHKNRVTSDIIRLYIYKGLVADGYEEALKDDPTFCNLQKAGLI